MFTTILGLLVSLGPRQVPDQAPVRLGSLKLLVDDAKTKGMSVFAEVPESSTGFELPNSIDDLNVVLEADWESHNGDTLCVTRSSYPWIPKPWPNQDYEVIHNARSLLRFTKYDVHGTIFQVSGKAGDVPDAIRHAYFGTTFASTGGDTPDDANERRIATVLSPGYVVTDLETGDKGTYALKKGALSQAGASITIPRNEALEDLRAASLAPLKSKLATAMIPPQKGVLQAQALVDLVSKGSGVPLVLDRRFSHSNILVVMERPLNAYDVLLNLLKSTDLYLRQDVGINFIGVSQGDPRKFEDSAASIERYNYGVEVIETLYRHGVIPSFVPPAAFVDRSQTSLWTQDLKRTLANYLLSDTEIAFGKDVLRAANSSDVNRFKFEAYVSFDNQLSTDYSRSTRGTVFP